jgi:c-di-GMP-binding flagellar brake protein YcgR
MQIGTTLEIQIEKTDPRLTCELFAVEEGKFLIIKMSPFQSLQNATRLVHKGTSIAVRYMHEGTVFGFKSLILHFMVEPAKLIFIKYPDEIESYDLRVHKRIYCYLPANVRIADKAIEGTIIDISKEGCQFSVKNAKAENSLKLHVDNEISVSFQLPGVEKELIIAGEQKNIKKDRDSVSIGIKFSNMNIEVQEKLYDFLSKAEA